MRPGAKAIVIYNKRILLNLRDDFDTIPHPNTWDLPGGGIEDGETPEETLKREIKEELNISPEHIIYLGCGKMEGLPAHKFLVFLNHDEYSSIRKGPEGQALHWYKISQLSKIKLNPHFAEFIEKNLQVLIEIVENREPVNPSKFQFEE